METREEQEAKKGGAAISERPGGLKLVTEIGKDEDMEGSGSKDDHFEIEVFLDREPV